METLVPNALKNKEAAEQKILTVLTGAGAKKRKRDGEEGETPSKKTKVDEDGDEKMN